MKVGDPVVMGEDKLPDIERMIFFAVEGPVNEFDLWNLLVQEKLQFSCDTLFVSKIHTFFNGR